MATFVEIYDVATNPDHILRKQFAVAIHQCAQDVFAENPATENHANRIAWARRVTNHPTGPVNEAERWIWKVMEAAGPGTDPLAIADAQVKNVTEQIVDHMANAKRG